LASIKAHPALLEGEIATVDDQIVLEIARDGGLARRTMLFCSIPGIGAVTAAVLIAELPELGQCNKKRIAALADRPTSPGAGSPPDVRSTWQPDTPAASIHRYATSTSICVPTAKSQARHYRLEAQAAHHDQHPHPAVQTMEDQSRLTANTVVDPYQLASMGSLSY
jgi:transposase